MDSNDNLTWCHPNYKTKYLMDICEIYAGLNALGELFDVLGASDLAQQYRAKAQLTRKAIELGGRPGSAGITGSKIKKVPLTTA